MVDREKLIITASIVWISAGLIGCQPEAPADAGSAPKDDAVTIMSFNVENLFDNNDDPMKIDNTFLAVDDKQSDQHKTECGEIPVDRWRDQCLYWDWNDEIVDKKLRVIAAAILQVDDGRGPDIIALQEVENIAILERLRKDYLGAADYLPAILIEGHDARGIDVAFLSRLPMAEEAHLHPFPKDGLDEKSYGDTRGILEATFLLPDGSLLTGFSVHFPAPFHPTEMRVTAYEQLNELKGTLPADRGVFAAGDFNTTSREDSEKNMLQLFARPLWTIVHDAECVDCRGTQYYARDGSWSYLDMILWSPAKKSGEKATWSIRAGSFAIANGSPDQITADGTPARFEMPHGTGVSDHWPIVVSIESAQKQ